MECVECGYSPLDVRPYQCNGRGGHTCGHKAFDRKVLKNAKARSLENLMCKECAQMTLHCLGCKAYVPQRFFGKDMWKHDRQGRNSVCTRCEAIGLSPRDELLYLCNQCGKEYGHMKFDKQALKNFKDPSRTAKLCCQLCRTESTNSSAAAKVRQTSLLSILWRKDALRCTCKHIPRGQRAHHALYNNFHTEKCKLHPTKMGEVVGRQERRHHPR